MIKTLVSHTSYSYILYVIELLGRDCSLSYLWAVRLVMRVVTMWAVSGG